MVWDHCFSGPAQMPHGRGPRDNEFLELILLVLHFPTTEEFLKSLSGSRGRWELIYDPSTRPAVEQEHTGRYNSPLYGYPGVKLNSQVFG